MIYLHKFDDPNDVADEYYENEEVTKDTPWVSYFNNGHTEEVLYQKSYKDIPLTVEGLGSGTVTLLLDGLSDDYSKEIWYSVNYDEWICVEPFMDDETWISISFEEGDIIQFKGYNSAYYGTDGSSSESYLRIQCWDGECKIYGNIMSLIDGDYFTGLTSLTAPYTFTGLFSGGQGIVDASNLILPATVLTPHCYEIMFRGCDSLEYPPKIFPATIVPEAAYSSTFENCDMLVAPPKLLMTTLSSGTTHCAAMFKGCGSLEYMPELLPTTVYSQSYTDMFMNCTSLTECTELPATTLGNHCYNSMFKGCTALVKAPNILPATTLADYCYQAMFYGCDSLEDAPILPATTLASRCYSNMFYGCSDLRFIKAGMTEFNNNGSSSWVRYVGQSGVFVKNPSLTDSFGISAIPEGWEVRNNV